MKVGDLIRDLAGGELGFIVSVRDRRRRTPYNVLCADGVTRWLPKLYIEHECEVIDESR